MATKKKKAKRLREVTMEELKKMFSKSRLEQIRQRQDKYFENRKE